MSGLCPNVAMISTLAKSVVLSVEWYLRNAKTLEHPDKCCNSIFPVAAAGIDHTVDREPVAVNLRQLLELLH